MTIHLRGYRPLLSLLLLTSFCGAQTVGNELSWYIFDGEPRAKDGFIDLDDQLPGLD